MRKGSLRTPLSSVLLRKEQAEAIIERAYVLSGEVREHLDLVDGMPAAWTKACHALHAGGYAKSKGSNGGPLWLRVDSITARDFLR